MNPQPSPEAVQQVWMLSLAIYFVVVGVVALLLWLILRAARDVRHEVSAIWTVGQKIANNTIHIALVGQTNHLAGRILASAGGVAAATAAIEAHAQQCPGCPQCVLGPGGAR